MPGMKGDELLRRVANMPVYTSCLLITGAEEYTRSKEAVYHHVLLKPFNPARLTALVLQLARLTEMKRSVHSMADSLTPTDAGERARVVRLAPRRHGAGVVARAEIHEAGGLRDVRRHAARSAARAGAGEGRRVHAPGPEAMGPVSLLPCRRAAARAGRGAARGRRGAGQAPLGPCSSHHRAMRTCISSTETSSMTADRIHWCPNGSSISALSPAVELVRDRVDDLGPRLDGARGDRVGVLDVQREDDRRAAERLRAARVPLGASSAMLMTESPITSSAQTMAPPSFGSARRSFSVAPNAFL